MASNVRQQVIPPKVLLTQWLGRLYEHRLTTTTGGNLSIIDGDVMYITPSGGDKAIVPAEKIAYRKLGDSSFQGPVPPSMEWPLHLAAYEACRRSHRENEIRAVLHAHSKTLMAFSLALCDNDKEDLGRNREEKKHDNTQNEDDPRIPNTRCILGAFQACGKVAVAPYALPGSQELADACFDAFSKGADCVILENHGVVVVGESLHQAYDRFVSLESLAQSMVYSQPLGFECKPVEEHVLRRLANKAEKHAVPSFFDENRVMSGIEKELRADLCKFVRRAYGQQLITSSSGSFSVRLPKAGNAMDGLSFLITPSGVDRKEIEEADLCFLSNHLASPNKETMISTQPTLVQFPVHHPSSPERVSASRAARMHATIFEHHPNIDCILVTQPPYATAFCLTGCPMDSGFMPESHVVLRDVKTLTLKEALKHNGEGLAKTFDPEKGINSVLVQNYGVVTVGKSLLQAFVQLEVLESMCCVTLQARTRCRPLAPLTKKQRVEVTEAFFKHV
ncbi:class II aldolase/adducin family protein [Nitzschia inconspicua]|uniref:Class II aldolase/adducin family protein n=1 Tax=Nitzschia inconspicua TaxID=303405 RepID=A0A9K3PFM0_9STRA|nr:class II aldolase/adducin family protein [Nitzschia inconspicua]